MLRYDGEQEMIEWAMDRVKTGFRDDARAMGWETEQGLRAVAVFDCFYPHDLHMHIASDGRHGWLTRRFLVAVFHYAFVVCGVRRVTGLVPAKNHKALRFDQHLGFRYEGRCADAFPDDDLVILGMTRKECRWLPKEVLHGQEQQRAVS